MRRNLATLFLLALLAALLPSCAIPMRHDGGGQPSAPLLDRPAPGNLSLDDVEAVLDSRIADVAAAFDSKTQLVLESARDAVEEAKEARIAAGKPTSDPITWKEWLLAGLTTALLGGGGGAVVLNTYRNRLRAARGEPVGMKQ